jgi:hypothetical protein
MMHAKVRKKPEGPEIMRYWQVYVAFAVAALLIALFGTGVLKGTNPPPLPPGHGPEHEAKDPRFYRIPSVAPPANETR